MRRVLQCCAALALSFSALARPALGDPWETGFVAGGNASNFRGRFANLADTEFKPGFVGGAFVAYRFSPNVAIQSEALFTQKGATTRAVVTDENGLPLGTEDVFIELDYVEVPVLARLGVARFESATPYVIAGPAFAFPVDGRMRVDAPFANEAIVDRMKRVDIGVVMGAGLRIGDRSPRLIMEGSYTAGLEDLYDVDNNLESINSTFSVLIGVAFSPRYHRW